MRIHLAYEQYTYGTKGNPAHYTVTLSRANRGKQVRVEFMYARPVAGRGVGPHRGRLRGVTLTFPAKTAQALSGALQMALADISSGVEFTV